MKALIRKIAVYSLAFFVLSQVVNGVRISGGAAGVVICAIAFTIFSLLLSPIIKLIGFPIRMVSFGLFPLVINAVLLFILSLFISNFTVTAFFFPGLSFAGFMVPKVFFNAALALAVASVVFSTSVYLVNWVTGK